MNQSVKKGVLLNAVIFFYAYTETFDEICRLLENDDINRLALPKALLKLFEVKRMLK